jgi:hypothetical protein
MKTTDQRDPAEFGRALALVATSGLRVCHTPGVIKQRQSSKQHQLCSRQLHLVDGRGALSSSCFRHCKR